MNNTLRGALPCPHCAGPGIGWPAKRACAIERIPCRCNLCGGQAQEARWPRTFYSALLYGYLTALGSLGTGLAGLAYDANSLWILAIAAPVLILTWFAGRNALLDYSLRRVPLVALHPSARCQNIKDWAGGILGMLLLLLVAIAAIVKFVQWLASLLPA